MAKDSGYSLWEKKGLLNSSVTLSGRRTCEAQCAADDPTGEQSRAEVWRVENYIWGKIWSNFIIMCFPCMIFIEDTVALQNCLPGCLLYWWGEYCCRSFKHNSVLRCNLFCCSLNCCFVMFYLFNYCFNMLLVAPGTSVKDSILKKWKTRQRNKCT